MIDAKVIAMLRDLSRSALRRLLADAWIAYRINDAEATLRARVEGYYIGGAIKESSIVAEWMEA